MNRKPNSLPIETWQFFNACVYHLGKSSIEKIYKKGFRQIEKWSCDPDTSESSTRNPVDRYESLLKKLMERGHHDVARTCVERQASIVGAALSFDAHPIPDKDTVNEEIIDDIPFISRYSEILQNPSAKHAEVKKALDDLIRELRENYTKKCIEEGWGIPKVD